MSREEANIHLIFPPAVTAVLHPLLVAVAPLLALRTAGTVIRGVVITLWAAAQATRLCTVQSISQPLVVALAPVLALCTACVTIWLDVAALAAAAAGCLRARGKIGVRVWVSTLACVLVRGWV